MTDIIQKLENLSNALDGKTVFTDEDAIPISIVLDAAISELKARECVEIDKVPDEWKNGRKVVVLIHDLEEAYYAEWGALENETGGLDYGFLDGGYWVAGEDAKITHAMLPPSTSKPEGTG